MNGAGRALLLLPVAALLWSAAPARAAASPTGRYAFLVIVDRISFEQAMGEAGFRALAAGGGAALMTTRTSPAENTDASYRTIANGASTEPGGSVAGGLVATLARHGVQTCLETGRDSPLPGNDPLRAFAGGRVDACLPLPPNDFGGAPNLPSRTLAGLTVITGGRTLGAGFARLGGVAPRRPVLTIVVSPLPSPAMDRRGDEVTPLFMATGRGDRLLTARGTPHALTSATTRLDGLVANVDVAPTILRWFGVPVPPSMDGDPIEITDAPAPFALHRLELEQRRTRLPIQLAEVAFIAAAGIAAIAALVLIVRGRRLRPATSRRLRLLTLGATALPFVVLAGGLLPHRSYAWVFVYLVLATAALAWVATRARWPGVLGPFVFLGAVAMVFVLIDGLFGGNAFRVPLLGNTAFDGTRFYGLSNSFIAMLLASALFVAHRLERRAGAVLLFAVGLFAGFPRLGINIGAAVTIFAAAGLWWELRRREQLAWRDVLPAAVALVVAVVAGLAIVFAANRFLPGTPTHATRFVERASGNAGFGVATLARRVGVAFTQLNHVPAAYLPMLGLPAVLVVVLIARGAVRRGIELERGWRALIVVLVVAALVAYVANDTGVSAAAPAFLYAMAAIAYPVFLLAERGDVP